MEVLYNAGGIAARWLSPGRWEHCIGVDRTGTGLDVIEWAQRLADLGASALVVTSVKQEGTGQGYEFELTRAVSEAVDIPVIASGGVGNLDHLVEGVTKGGASAVLAASIFHFGDYTVAEAKAHMIANGIPMRLT